MNFSENNLTEEKVSIEKIVETFTPNERCFQYTIIISDNIINTQLQYDFFIQFLLSIIVFETTKSHLIQLVINSRIYYIAGGIYFIINIIAHNFPECLTFLRQFNYKKSLPRTQKKKTFKL